MSFFHFQNNILLKIAVVLLLFIFSCTSVTENDSKVIKKKCNQIKLTVQNDSILNPSFIRINIDDGLSQSTINCMVQDSSDHIWFGTQYGLNRFDGYNFKVYNSEHFRNCINNINAIFYDSLTNAIYCSGDNNMLEILNISMDSIIVLNLPVEKITSILNIQLNLLIGSSEGLFLFNKVTHKCKKIYNSPIFSMFESNNKVYCGSQYNILLYNIKLNNVLPLINIHPNLKNSNVTCITNGANNSMWFGTMDEGLFKLDTISEDWYQYEYSNSKLENNINSLILDKDSTLWIGTEKGLYYKNEKTKSFIVSRHDTRNKFSLSNNTILSFLVDRSGILWVGTKSGLHKYDKLNSLFKQYFIKDIIWCFSIKDNCLLVGTENNGLLKYKYNTNLSKWSLPSIQNKLTIPDKVMSICYDSNSNFIIGTDKGIYSHNIATNNYKKYSILSKEFITKIIKTDSIFIAGSKNGIYLFNNENILAHFDVNNSSLLTNNISTLFKDSKNRIWIGTNGGGVYLKEKNSLKLKVFTHQTDSFSLSDNTIRTINEDSQKNIWIGTDNGLNKFIEKSNLFISYNKNNGLPVNVIYSIVCSDDGLWLSTLNGIFYVKFVNNKLNILRNYDINDGLQSNEFSADAFVVDTLRNEYFFGGINGFNSFNQKDTVVYPFIPKIKLSDLRILDEEGNKTPLSKENIENLNIEKEIILSEPNNNIEVSFSSLHYSNPKKIKYELKKEYEVSIFESWYDYFFNYKSNSSEWVILENNEPSTRYTYLNPGHYKLIVKATNSNGIWNKYSNKATILRFYIKTPLRKSWKVLLISLGILFVIFILISTNRKRLKALRTNVIYLFTANKKLDYQRKTLENDKRVLETDKQVLENEKQLLETDKQRLENEKQLLETDKQRLENEKQRLEIEKSDLKKKVKDLTNRNILQAQNLAKNDLLRTLSHQWRQPLSIINLVIEDIRLKLQKDLIDINVYNSSISSILKTTKYLSDTIDHFFSFTKEESSPKSFDVSLALNTAIDIIFPYFEIEHFTISRTFESKIYINNFKSAFLQVILIILENAKQIFEERSIVSPVITINFSIVNEDLVVIISDNGGGFDEGFENKIFEKGYTTRKKGSGIGLSSAKNLTESIMKSSIIAKNTENGAQFIITLININE